VVTGIGLDIVSIARIRDLFTRHGERLRNDLFSENEWAGLRQIPDAPDGGAAALAEAQVRYLSMLFAAKEAVFKAIAPPPSLAFNWRDIEIEACHPVQPRLHGELKAYADIKGIMRLSGGVCASGRHAAAVIIGETS
jgi:phosphopantetheine--protein transferase-like protein